MDKHHTAERWRAGKATGDAVFDFFLSAASPSFSRSSSASALTIFARFSQREIPYGSGTRPTAFPNDTRPQTQNLQGFPSRMRSQFTTALVAVAMCLITAAKARYECHSETIPDQYPFCVNIPDTVTHEHHDGRLPTIIYMGGSGTFGPPDEIATLVSGAIPNEGCMCSD